MDIKRNIRFFKQTDLWRIIGGALAVVGTVWLYFGWSAASYYGPIFMIPIGATLFIVCSARVVPESEIRQNVQKAMQGLGQDVTEGRMASKLLQAPAPYCAQGICYDETASMFRRGKDSKVLSDVFCTTMFYFTEDALLIRARSVVLTTVEAKEVALRLEWQKLQSAEPVPFERRVKLSNARNAYASVRGAEIHLKGCNGELLYRAPIPNDITAEELCENISRMCRECAKKNA